ncbi:MAG: hypothetical protein Q9218_005659 [Villophora microphyllina]
MQIKSLVAFVSLAIAATALPAENMVKRTGGQEIQNQCSQGQTASCCNSATTSLINLIPVNLGLNCIDLPLSGQCNQNQQLACCSSGTQSGLVNVGNVCPIVL